jgi:hypothetical protein
MAIIQVWTNVAIVNRERGNTELEGSADYFLAHSLEKMASVVSDEQSAILADAILSQVMKSNDQSAIVALAGALSKIPKGLTRKQCDEATSKIFRPVRLKLRKVEMLA